MAEDLGAWAAGLLVDEAWAAIKEGRYRAAVAAASRAAEAARQLDDPVLLVRALTPEAGALQMMGDSPAALARYTEVLGLAQDPATSGRLEEPRAVEMVARAHWSWVECARFVTGIPVRELFGVLDAAERWLAAAGHQDWRAAILSERSDVHRMLGETDQAVAAAEEALAVALQHPNAPGYTLGAYRFSLGNVLRDAGRADEAAGHYRAVLTDPAASPWDRNGAHEGLVRCALAAGDPGTARREARAAVLLAEALGDDALCTSLGVLAEACLADGDVAEAWQAAVRHLEAAARIGGHYRPYYAVRTAVDVALDRGDLPAARRLLGEFDEHAAALDANTGTTLYTGEIARRRQRLASIEKTPT